MSGRRGLVPLGRRLAREPIEALPAASSRAAGYRAGMRASRPVRYEVADGGVATVTLDEPETRNALSDEVLDGLLEAFTAARDDAAVRCVVLTSSHEKVFSSGGDLAGFAAEQPLAHKHAGIERFMRLFELIGMLGKPSICAANGHVLAGALGLALACDLVVAKEGVRFGTPEINVGVFPFMIMALIYRNVGRKKTNELLLLGEQIPAEEAERIGLVNRVVPAAEFDAFVADWARKLAAKSPVLMKLGKDAMFRQQDMAFAEALDYLRAQLAIAFATEDIQEGVKAFFEKREPVWTGR
jgi:enoyl-CoA hydratase